MLKREDAEHEIRPHDLRHTYATMLYDAGIDVKSAQYFLGHADVSVTMQIYTHLSNERKAKSVDALFAYADKMRDDVKNDVKKNCLTKWGGWCIIKLSSVRYGPCRRG